MLRLCKFRKRNKRFIDPFSLLTNKHVAVCLLWHKSYGYGHVGDGNLHLTIPALIDSEELREKIDEFVYSWLSEYYGPLIAIHHLS